MCVCEFVYMVILLLMQRPALEFFGMIHARALARDLFITYARYAILSDFVSPSHFLFILYSLFQ